MLIEEELNDLQKFEKARYILLTCAYNRGMWEEVEVTSLPYLTIKKNNIIAYSMAIDECYEIIKELRDKGKIT